MVSIPNVLVSAPSSPHGLAHLLPWRRALRALAWSIGALWSLLLIAWLILHWGILNHIEQWRPQIEARVGAALGTTVQIGHIQARSSGWLPAIELRDVVVLDARQQPALVLPRVSAALSPRSVLALDLRLEQLLIEGAQLEVRRDALGRIFVGGLDVGRATASDGDRAAVQWFFKQHEIVVRAGSLRWTDEQRLAPPLELSDLTLVIRNGLRHHDIRLDATPPAQWGHRFSVQGQFTQPLLADSGDWRRWSGTLSANLPHADARQFHRYVNLPFELSEGEGALRGWLELEDGEPRELTLDLALRLVALRLAGNVQPLAFEQIEGRLVVTRSRDAGAVAAQQFGFVTADGLRWPRSDIKLAWHQRRDGTASQPVSGGEFSAQRLDLGLLAQLAERLPPEQALRQWLADFAPKGIGSALTAHWEGPLAAPTRYAVKGRFAGLSLASHAATVQRGVGRPGLHNADIELSANETGGQAQLELHGGALEFPGVFDDALVPLDSLAARLAWRVTPGTAAGVPPQLELKVTDASFANTDAKGDFSATWRTGAAADVARGGRYPGQLELNGKLSRASAGRTARYLPRGLPDSVRDYVARAVTGGVIAGASFRVKGDLWDFPFLGSKSGEFRIAAKVDDVNFAYMPSAPASASEPAFDSPWPALTKVSAELVFDRATMEVRNGQGRAHGFELRQVNGGIRNLADRSVLMLEGNGRGPLADALRFVNGSPVGEWTRKALSQTSATGHGDLRLALNIPLFDASKSTVQGTVVLDGNDVRLRPDMPVLGAARGRVEFTRQGLTIVGGAARVLGGDASFEGGTRSDGSLRFSAQGVASADGMRRATELPGLTRLGAALHGQTAYRLNLGFVHGYPEMTLTSNLVGLGADLPPPLRKAPETSLPLRVQTSVHAETLAPGQAPRDTLRVELGNLVQALYVRDLSRDAPVVLRGGLGVNESAPQPTSGVAANLNLGVVDVDAWSAFSKKLFDGGGAPAQTSPDSGGYLPNHLALRAQQVTTGVRRLTKVVAGISQSDGTWRANVDADQLSGYIEYRAPRRAGAGAAGLVHARLSRLSLPKSDAESVESLLDEQPASIPALDIVIDDFQLRDKHLGRVEIEAVNRAATDVRDAPREWLLSRFQMTTPEATLSAAGTWAAVGAAAASSGGQAGAQGRRALMNFKLDLADSGAFLERLGMGKAIKGGKGLLAGQLAWLGSPLAPDFTNMTGEVNLSIEAGQFLKVEPGVARLLGVLSLQSLPRRLALDFRDLFQEGFAFDSVIGDVKIVQGVASTNNLRMRGVQAAVLIEGSADITRETQDLRVVVVPEINAATASLAYAVINPAIGLGTFLAQVFLRRPLMQAGTREFHVSGPWTDPKVERVDRKVTQPIPAELEVPAAAAPAPPTNP